MGWFSDVTGIGGGGASDSGISGALINLGGNIYSTERSGQFAGQDRDWQERMSNTAYQRSMLDMKEAGLNPILAYQKGGASTPSGAQGVAAKFDNIASGAREGYRVQAEVKGITAKTAESRQAASKLKTASKLDIQLIKKAAQEQKTSAMQMNAIEIQNVLNATKIPGAEVEAAIDKSTYGKALRYLNRGANSILGTARGVLTGAKVGTELSK